MVLVGLKWRQRLRGLVILLAVVSLAVGCGEFELVSFTPTSTTLSDLDEMEDYPGVSTTMEVDVTTTILRPARYTVEPGDSLSDLGTRFGVSIDALVKANNLPSADAITVGQVLVIPDPFEPVTPPWVLNGIDHAGRDR